MMCADSDGRRRPRAAFFDLDNTLLRGSSVYFMARGLITRRAFTARQLAEIAYRQGRFLVTGAEKATDLASIVTNAQSLVRGRPVQQVIEFGQQIFEEQIVGRLWREALGLVAEHQEAGDEVWLVTATGQEIADMMADHLGLTGALGTRSEVTDGRYTGQLAGPVMHGEAKAAAVGELARDHGIDLEASYAYSDSANDIPMLSLVGHPVAINPDRALRRWAEESGAGILDFTHPNRLGRALTSARRLDVSRLPLPLPHRGGARKSGGNTQAGTPY